MIYMRKKLFFLIILTVFIFFLSSCFKNENKDSKLSSVNSATPSVVPSTQPSTKPSEISSTQPSTTISSTTTNKEIVINEIYGYNEMIYISIEKTLSATYVISYKKTKDTYYKTVGNTQYIDDGNYINCEINGISLGLYDVKVTAYVGHDKLEKKVNNIVVSALDRSGYAHFKSTEGIGAYNNDGTLKDNAIILVLTNENKNTITAIFNNTKYVGIVNILNNLNKSTKPVLIKVKGKITTNQWNYKEVIPRLTDDSNLSSTHFENTFSNEYGENIENLYLNLIDKKEGLIFRYKTTKNGILKAKDTTTSKATVIYGKNEYPELKGKEVYHDDSSYNCVSISNAKNITIEGIDSEAEIFQWGFSFSNCNSVEIKNLTFTDYPEDAIGFSSSSADVEKYGRYWVHNNVFNRGKNNWDLTGEQDKYAGDGALDITNVSNVTASYNIFNNCNKTGLVSSSDNAISKNITFHHNYYKNISSRLPLARGANIHIYNNIYDNCLNCLHIKNNSYVLSEENYFYISTNCHRVENAAIKSYNDIFVSSSTVQSIKVDNRETYVENLCSFSGVDYSSFDIDSNLFYYDAQNKKSDVCIMNKAKELKPFLTTYCGINGKYNMLPLTQSEDLNNSIYNEVNSNLEDYNKDALIFDPSSLTINTKIEEGNYIMLGDFKFYYGYEFASGNSVVIKNLGSNFNNKTGLIEFTNISNTELTIIFASRNSTATNRHLILYDEYGNELGLSECANGSEKTKYTISLEPNTKYYIGSNLGIIIYNMY